MVNLDNIVGQSVPVSVLKRGLLAGSLGHAYLFTGPPGLGKRTTALAVARELKQLGGEYSELRVLAGEGVIGIDEIRALRREAGYASSGHLIWIIAGADRMTPEAANTFLKDLEEPQPGTYFFLTATKREDLLPTIVSRCQHLSFRAVEEGEIRSWLAEKSRQDSADPQIKLVARLAQGSLGKAWEYWQGGLFEYREEIIARLISLPNLSYPEVLGMSQAWPEDRQTIGLDLQLMLEWYRDLLTLKGETNIPLYNCDYEQKLREISGFYSRRRLFFLVEQISQVQQAVRGNARLRFCLGYLLLLMKRGALTECLQ